MTNNSILKTKSVKVATSEACISVVIPLFNKKNTIERSLMSVIRQLHFGDEIIVVDDGSSDGGAEDLALKIGSEASVRVIKQPNLGVSVARNRGVDEAIHDHIVLLDADDWWLMGYRSKIGAMIAKWPLAVAWSVGHYRVDGSQQVFIDSGLREDTLLSGAEFINQYGKYSGVINSSSVCVRKEVIKAIGGFPVGATSGEDIYVWLHLGLAGDSIAVSPEPLVSVERSLSLKKNESTRDAVGFHYLYFCREEVLSSYEEKQIAVLKLFMFRNGMRQIAGKLGSGDRVQAWKVSKTIGRAFPSFLVIVSPLLFLPKQFFKYAFRLRHRLSLN